MSLGGVAPRRRATSLRAVVVSLLLASGSMLIASCGGSDEPDAEPARRKSKGGQAGSGSKGGTAGAGGASGLAGAAGNGTSGASGVGVASAPAAGAAGSVAGSAGAGISGASGAAGSPPSGAGGLAAGTSGTGGAMANGGAGMGGKATAGAGGTAAGAAGVGGAAAGSGGAPGAKEAACIDGIDDDKDGAFDCADSDCAGKAKCLPAPPAGFTGPFAVVKKLSTEPTTACAGGALPARRFGGEGAPVECAPCGCGPRTGASCALSSVQVATGIPANTDCNGAFSVDLASATCGDFAAPTDPGLAVRASVTEVKGICAPTGGALTKRPPLFPDAYDSCPVEAGNAGCPGGGACGATPAGGQICIFHVGVDAFCPPAWPTRMVVSDGAADGRDCGTCTCADPPGNVCGPAQLKVLMSSACQPDFGPNLTAEANGMCRYFNVSDLPDRRWHLTAEPIPLAAPSCDAKGGGPTGSVQATDAHIFCCL